MPTSIVPGQKTAFIDIVNVVDPIEALRLQDILVNYDDIVTAIRRQLDVFASNPGYLFEAMNVFAPNNADLIAAGIYNNSSSGSIITNPNLLINFTSSNIILSDISDGWINLLGNSYAETITVAADDNLTYLYIGPGSTVDLLDSSQDGAFVNNIYLPFLKNKPSTLRGIAFGSFFGSINKDEGSYYGGIKSYVPSIACTIPVTNLVVGIHTHDSIELKWMPPNGGYLYIDTYFKKSDSGSWILATDDNGFYVQDTGFMVRNLEEDTSYDFRVCVTCINGGKACVELLDQQTRTASVAIVGRVNTFGNCSVSVLIVSVPDPSNVQTLCNGTVYFVEYAPGTTLTILNADGLPLMAGVASPDEIVIDNVPYQSFPFNSSTGEFDASTTPVGSFIAGNIITFEADFKGL